MGFFKKIKKAVKKVTKPVSKVVKKVVKPVAKVAKGVGKAVLPVAGSVLSAAAGNYLGGKATAGLSSLFGSNSITKGLGNAVSQGTANYMDAAFNSLSGSNSPYGGVSMPQYNNNQLNAGSPSRIGYGVPSGNSGYQDDMTAGVNFIKQVSNPIKSASDQGKDTKDYLAAAYPELNPWERSGAGGTMFGSEMTGDIMTQDNLNKQLASNQALQKSQLQKDLAIAQLQSDTQLQVNAQNNQTALQAAQLQSETSMYNTGVQSQTSRMNTYDQVQLGYKNAEIAETRMNADIQKVAADTDLSRQNKEESISRIIKMTAETQNIKLSADQIRAMTQQALAQAAVGRANVGLIGQQTASEHMRQPGILQTNENLRYGTGSISREAQSVGNMVGDAASGVADWWNNLWSDSSGVRGSMSRK